jgi:hypothetical protein
MRSSAALRNPNSTGPDLLHFLAGSFVTLLNFVLAEAIGFQRRLQTKQKSLIPIAVPGFWQPFGGWL